MAAIQDDDDDGWDKDTDEINDIDSEELYETRPNRWRGPASSWRTLTNEDRLTWSALEGLRNQDLSLHLYNAFALKHTHSAAPDKVGPAIDHDIDAETGQPVRGHDWVPPPSWTAWPMRANLVPGDDFMKTTEGEDDAFTFRRAEAQLPSTALEEIVSATILRHAKDKFRQRDLSGRSQASQSGSHDVHLMAPREMKQEVISSADEAWRSEDDTNSSADSSSGLKMDVDAAPGAAVPPSRQQSTEQTFMPAVSTDDDLTCRLVRPSTRAILEKLDKTLMILHNVRTAGLDYVDYVAYTASDWEGDKAHDEGDDEADMSEKGRRRQARSRTRSPGAASATSVADDSAAPGGKKSSGRPRGSRRPREGESEREFLIRVAREQHRRLPRFFDDGDTSAEPDTAAEGDGQKRRPSHTSSRKRNTKASRQDVDAYKQEHLARWGLRDWSDVLGAAALAGFSPDVITRTRQRCSDLFGEDMHVLALDEIARTPGYRNAKAAQDIQTREATSPQADDEEDRCIRIWQARTVSRQPNLAPSHPRSSPELDSESDEGVSDAKQGSRSVSREILGAGYRCPYVKCPRAAQGFTRRRDLTRHINTVHPSQETRGAPEEEDSEDEMYGAVHVDGFLKPIKPRKGWHGEPSRRKARSVKRQSDPGSPPEADEEAGSIPLAHIKPDIETDDEEELAAPTGS
ncbi:RNA polymerase I specific transcription initiation factor [Pleurostoma richardsiae]|uniref:RNA polymerase I specific transcription initiation factor n=1 Tax=Pleurostoma richardsiae TaxID=41990 RepID=A0AA38VWD1_9PEZI|nr:RNA polymerase I specific transcription initiation factor [Pleurostoma richardsiae]